MYEKKQKKTFFIRKKTKKNKKKQKKTKKNRKKQKKTGGKNKKKQAEKTRRRKRPKITRTNFSHFVRFAECAYGVGARKRPEDGFARLRAPLAPKAKFAPARNLNFGNKICTKPKFKFAFFSRML